MRARIELLLKQQKLSKSDVKEILQVLFYQLKVVSATQNLSFLVALADISRAL